jgi:phenylpyruvate tautomerase PptA (4-oxalocrotonate tautomerase family)
MRRDPDEISAIIHPSSMKDWTMDTTDRPNSKVESTATSGGINRRAVLVSAAVAAGAVAAVSPVLAETVPAASFGAPLVEVQVPAGVLTLEQKAAMIKGITDVVLKATKLASDPAGKSFVQIFEAADGGFGVNGQVFVPRAK